jgi:hypothetical protein
VAAKIAIDADRILENAAELFECVEQPTFVAVDELREFVKAWNAKQTFATLNEDRTRVVVLTASVPA